MKFKNSVLLYENEEREEEDLEQKKNKYTDNRNKKRAININSEGKILISRKRRAGSLTSVKKEEEN